MKKFFLIAFIFLFSSISAFPVTYSEAWEAYNNEDYETAKEYFKSYLKQYSANLNARYMLAQTLIKLGDYDNAKNEYITIISLDENSEAAVLAKEGLELLDGYNSDKKVAENQDTSNNYLLEAVAVGNKRIWNVNRNIGYYIERSKYSDDVAGAFGEWAGASRNLRIVPVNSSSMANIVVKFSNSTPTDYNAKNELASIEYKYSDKYISKATITFYPNYKKNIDLYPIFLHQIGHVIGIKGHSKNSSDVMAMPQKFTLKQLSNRDINTINALYDGKSKAQYSKKAIKKARKNEYLAQIEADPKNPKGYINLGNYYFSIQNYSKALTNYKKAELLDDKNIKILDKIYNCSKKLKDVNTQIAYGEKIIQRSPKNKNMYIELLNIYEDQLRLEEGNTLFKKLLKEIPSFSSTDRDRYLHYQSAFSSIRALQIKRMKNDIKTKFYER